MANNSKSFHIRGMTCTSCEVIIERKIKQLPNVENVDASCSNCSCTITTKPGTHVTQNDIERALQDTEYEVVGNDEKIVSPVTGRHLLKIAATLIVVYVLASQFGLLTLDTSVNGTLTLGAIFTIGLIASVSSCIAVVGGLVLTYTATVKRVNPNASRWKLLRAHLFFNGGRLISYFMLGGVVAVLGSALAPSPAIVGIITLVAAIIMVLLALDILGVSGASHWIPRLPKQISHWIYGLAERKEWWIPFVLGAFTFFVPCGFTQSMQIYALTTGSFIEGALTLFVFALGTLPALLGIGALASFTSSRGKTYRWFMIIAGCIVLLLGLYNIKNSLNLLGINVSGWFSQTQQTANVNSVPSVVQGDVQVVEMAVDGIDYIPNKITVQQNMPVQWQIDGTQATGCTSVITIPSLGVTKTLNSSGTTTVEFTPTKLGRLPFTCGMGMAYGEFEVVQ